MASEVVRDLGWTDSVGVFQVTSPATSTETLVRAITEFFDDAEAKTMSSAEAMHGIVWHAHHGELGERVNRQDTRPVMWKETGGIRLVRSAALLNEGEVASQSHRVFEVEGPEAIDIDSHGDLVEARQAMGVGLIHFEVAVGRDIGSGHLFRCLALADELSHHDVSFSLRGDPTEAWWTEMVERAGYVIRPIGSRRNCEPGVVISDRLDTSVEDHLEARALGWAIIALEDLGPGAALADAIVNELYRDERPNALTGPAYSVLRPEFINAPPHRATSTASVLVSFGGTDPAQLNAVAARALGDAGLNVTVAAGPLASTGAIPQSLFARRPIVEEMVDAAVIVTSCGRTVHEAAAVGLPVVAIAVNHREMLHCHVDGVVYLGHAPFVRPGEIVSAVQAFTESESLRKETGLLLRSQVDGLGARRIVAMVESLIEGIG